DTSGADAGKSSVIGHVNRTCDGGVLAGRGGEGGAAVPVIRVVDCGPPQVAGQVRPGPGDVCDQVRNVCDAATVARLPKDPKITTATQQRDTDGSWSLAGIDCAVQAAAPRVTAVLVMREVRKLVPHPKVGIAPPGGATLVNIQTLLWADTPSDQSLGTVTLLGHQVTLQVHVAQVDWDFGDGQRDTTPSPEPRYDPSAGCKTVSCPGYWGHVYAATGAMTVSATVTWSGRYRVDGGAWLDIPGTVTGPATTAALTVRQARGVLVPNPGQH
ncbi:MAG: hypothetical protein QOD31_1933, partial [Pseudonocardiales bacterium]|nr:hypothetical protein [Pseudonocardiales bacterium]